MDTGILRVFANGCKFEVPIRILSLRPIFSGFSIFLVFLRISWSLKLEYLRFGEKEWLAWAYLPTD